MKDNRWTIESTEWQVKCFKISRKTKPSLEKWQRGATGSGMDKDRKGQRQLEGYFLQWKDTA